MKTYYKFQLIKTNRFIIEKGVTKEDSKVLGLENVYKVFKVNYIELFNRKFIINKRYIENVTFLKPYKKVWDKVRNRLPKVCWGKPKKPLINMWITISNDYNKLPDLIIAKTTTQLAYIKLFGVMFKSTEIKKHLNKCETFYINNQK